MPTIIAHAAVPLLLGAALGPKLISRPLLIAGTVAAMLPDIDVLAFKIGIAYADPLGHRGAMHSLAFACLSALLAAFLHRPLQTSRSRAFVFTGLAAASHPLLDACTNGGLGVELLWPLSVRRFFLPWRPIEVSPIGAHFFSRHAWDVLASELLWVWLPAAVIALLILLARRRLERQADPASANSCGTRRD
jgi:inner membrane protein